MSGLELIIIVAGLVALGWSLKQIVSLKQQAQKAHNKATSLEDEVTRLWTTQSELSTEAGRLQSEVDRLAKENQVLSQKSGALNTFTTLTDQIEQANVTLIQRRLEAQSLDQTIAEKQAKLTQLQTAGKKLQASYLSLQQKYQPLNDQITSLNRTLYLLQQKQTQGQADCQSLEATRLTLNDRCHDLRAEISCLEQEKQDLDRHIQTLKEKLQEDSNHYEAERHRIEGEYFRLLDREHRIVAYPDLCQKQEDLQQAIATLEQEKQRLASQLTDALAQAESELQGRRRIQIISACHQHSTSEQGLFHAKIDMNFSRVREALDFAEVMFGDVLEVWESARVSADASNFIRPDDAYRTLQSLAWFGQYYFEQNGAIGNNIYQVLRERYNLECTPEAKSVLNNRKLRDERCFWHSSQRKEMFDHLKLGGGNGMDNILRIYFAINCESQKIEIGHCGRHP